MSKNQFVENLKSYGLGALLDEAADEQIKIVAAVMATAKKGKLTLEINYSRRGNHEIEVSANVKSSVPKFQLEKVNMFVPSGKAILYDENPDQLTHENVMQMDREKKTVNKV